MIKTTVYNTQLFTFIETTIEWPIGGHLHVQVDFTVLSVYLYYFLSCYYCTYCFYSHCLIFPFSVFDDMSIPYPKRKVITEDDAKDEKPDHKVQVVK